MKKFLLKVFLVLVVTALSQACVSLKPYERVYVNDPEMQMGSDAGMNFDNYVFSIREGATPAGSGEASGGCGCK